MAVRRGRGEVGGGGWEERELGGNGGAVEEKSCFLFFFGLSRDGVLKLLCPSLQGPEKWNMSSLCAHSQRTHAAALTIIEKKEKKEKKERKKKDTNSKKSLTLSVKITI